jgi:hypothetical protein
MIPKVMGDSTSDQAGRARENARTAFARGARLADGTGPQGTEISPYIAGRMERRRQAPFGRISKVEPNTWMMRCWLAGAERMIRPGDSHIAASEAMTQGASPAAHRGLGNVAGDLPRAAAVPE